MFHLDDAPTVKNHNLFQPCKTDKKKRCHINGNSEFKKYAQGALAQGRYR